MVEVRLEREEARAAIRYAGEQFVRAFYGAYQDATLKIRTIQVEINGIGAELAYAKWRKIPWDNDLDRFKRPDVGRAQIRSTDLENGRLIVRDDDADDEPFVLVVGKLPVYRIVGWCWGRQAKAVGERQAPNGRPAAFFVRQDDLTKIG